ncbi:MAG: hemolysin family protein [Timaviella obliquedivisa GSE-PSE-MK23-08B]|jgi:putative hemolysin|nr:hemolysin family protein [Timaviella obliquedivisa GSE-PSE-MK23-08B]
MIFDIIVVLLLTIANGIFSMSEMAVVSARKVRLQEMAERGDAKAKAALALANSPNRFLSTVQIGITLITILTGVLGGATLDEPLAKAIAQIPQLAPSSGAIASTLVVIAITYLSLIVGELVPKRLALNNPEKIALTIAIPMRLMERLTAPIVHLLGLSTDLLLKLMGSNITSDEPQITEEEIKVLMRQGTAEGTFDAAEQDMIERVFSLGDEPVSALITPRLDIVWLDLNDSLEVNRQKMTESRHSRYPVCQESLDDVLGIIHVKDLLAQNNQAIDLASVLHQPLFLAESTHALKVLELLKKTGNQLALVVNEYGVTQGLVTLNDVVEVIIGDIPFEDEEQEKEAIQREDGSWLMDGRLSINEFKELLNIEELPGEERDNYQTLGGFVITQLGHIPKSSNHFVWDGFRLEVMDMDGNRVDKVLVVPPSPVQRTEES